MIRKDYPTTGVLKRVWVSTIFKQTMQIRKDYPTTGVLRLTYSFKTLNFLKFFIRKDYPTTGVLRLIQALSVTIYFYGNQEGLPDYWGIETFFFCDRIPHFNILNQEGLPDYWGIETWLCGDLVSIRVCESGRITRLLGY